MHKNNVAYQTQRLIKRHLLRSDIVFLTIIMVYHFFLDHTKIVNKSNVWAIIMCLKLDSLSQRCLPRLLHCDHHVRTLCYRGSIASRSSVRPLLPHRGSHYMRLFTNTSLAVGDLFTRWRIIAETVTRVEWISYLVLCLAVCVNNEMWGVVYQRQRYCKLGSYFKCVVCGQSHMLLVELLVIVIITIHWMHKQKKSSLNCLYLTIRKFH